MKSCERVCDDSQAVTKLLKGKTGKISVSNECSYYRALSMARTRRTDQFSQQVRERDGMCVITKIKCMGSWIHGFMDSWVRFHSAHNFPTTHETVLDQAENSPRKGGFHSVHK